MSKTYFGHDFGLRQVFLKIQIVMCRSDLVGGKTTKNRTIRLNRLVENRQLNHIFEFLIIVLNRLVQLEPNFLWALATLLSVFLSLMKSNKDGGDPVPTPLRLTSCFI